MDKYLTFAASVLVGLISGVIGSLAPWVKWGIEKRRLKLEAKRRLIADARAELQHSPSKKMFRGSVLYSRLRPYLPAPMIEEIEVDTTKVRLGGRSGGADNYIPQVLDEICKLEKDWNLL